jgi:hypothetical protein
MNSFNDVTYLSPNKEVRSKYDVSQCGQNFHLKRQEKEKNFFLTNQGSVGVRKKEKQTEIKLSMAQFHQRSIGRFYASGLTPILMVHIVECRAALSNLVAIRHMWRQAI